MSQPSIRDLIEASFAAMAIETADWRMAIRKIRGALIDVFGKSEPQYRLCIWSVTKGIEDYPLIPMLNIHTGEEAGISQETDLIFRDGVRRALDPKTAVVLLNPRHFLDDEINIQRVIDVATAIRNVGSFLFLVGPDLKFPAELQSIIHRIEFALPTKKELIDLCLDEVILPNLDNGLKIDLPKKKTLKGLGTDALKKKVYKLNKAVFNDAAKAAQGLDSIAAENAFSLSVTMTGTLNSVMIQEHKRQAVAQTEVLEFTTSEDCMADVGGFDNLKAWLQMRDAAFTDEAKKFGVTPPKGILMVGHSGTGKSLVSRAMATALRVPLLKFDMSKVFDMWVGSSEARMRNALAVAEAIAPCCIHMDEIEKAVAGSKRGGDGSGVTARVLGQFLQWRAESTAPVFVCCTCNDVHAIPPEFYRPGRIDAIFYTDLPTPRERVEIFKIHLCKRGKQLDCKHISFKDLAVSTKGFTGAEIELCVTEAIFAAFNQNKATVTTEMLVNAAKGIVPQSKRNKEEMTELHKWASERAIPVSTKRR